MKKIIFIVLGLACTLFFISYKKTKEEKYTGKRTVEIKEENGKFQLYRNGKPYYIKGAGVFNTKFLHKIKESGANSVRLYSTENAQEILDSAYKLGLTVTLGLKLGYANKTLDYSDDKAVAAQFEKLKKEVIKYKDHPALLMWGIGNEISIFLGSRITNILGYRRVWKEIDAIAKMIHEIDPNHPTSIAFPGGSTALVRLTTVFCNDIDLLALNTFNPIEPLAQRVKENGWDGPFIISEFGANGYWNSKKTDWYSSTEQPSYLKALYMQSQYQSITSNTDKCLGSYAFLWGQKQEYTPTWFSFFTPKGQETDLTDACQYMWTGKKPEKTAQSIYYMLIDNQFDQKQDIYLEPGKKYWANIHTVEPLSKNLCLRWELHTDGLEYLDASYNDQQSFKMADSTFEVSNLVKDQNIPKKAGANNDIYFDFETPAKEGSYRLFIYLENEHGKASTANATFYVHNK